MTHPFSHRRVHALLASMLVLVVAGCGDDALEPLGGPCVVDADCEEPGFCYASVCLDPYADDDGDGLVNHMEFELTTDPFDADSDGDGFDDGEEVGPKVREPLDADGDGTIDALESAFADADTDCLPDQLDPLDAMPEEDLEMVKGYRCLSGGVCASSWADVSLVCVEGIFKCLYEAVEGFEEEESSCDGLDNDCDGKTDEGLTLDGLPLGSLCKGTGQCGVGQVECSPDTAAPICSSDVGGSDSQASDELCDGLDNDCDGVVDEGQTYNTLPLGAECKGTGACGKGVVECHPSMLVAGCSTDPGGSADQSKAELCNGLDDDCDGATDEGLTADPGDYCTEEGVCGAHFESVGVACLEGKWRCDYSSIPSYEADEARCDGLDNDCDGAADEPFTYIDFSGLVRALGDMCGTGACAGGMVSCSDDGAAAVCTTSGFSTAEICNGEDDDCDGVVDEELSYNGKSLGSKCLGIGECGEGVVECAVGTGATTCSTNPDGSASMATQEMCNGKDEDCDGLTDEGYSWPTGYCAAPGVCELATVTPSCVDGEFVCDYSIIQSYEPIESSCDYLDNDCDGVLDDASPLQFSGSWEPLTPTAGMPPYAPGVATVLEPTTGIAYRYGGEVEMMVDDEVTTTSLAGLWRFDLAAPGWKEVAGAALPGTRGQVSLATIPDTGEIVLWGGRRVDELGALLLDDVWRFSPTTGSWTMMMSSSPATPGYGRSAQYYAPDGILFLVGGGGQDGPLAWEALSLGDEPSLVFQDELQALPPIEGAATTLVDYTVVVFGGAVDGVVTDDLYLIDATTGETKPAPTVNTPSARRDAGLVVAGDAGDVYLFGGIDEAGQPLLDLHVLDVGSGVWSPISSQLKPPPVGRPALAAFDDALYLLGGVRVDGTPLMDVYSLTLDGLQWESWWSAPLPLPRRGGAMTYLEPYGLVLYGGDTVAGEPCLVCTERVWSYDIPSGTWTALPSKDGPTSSSGALVAVASTGTVLANQWCDEAATSTEGCGLFEYHPQTGSWMSHGVGAPSEPTPPVGGTCISGDGDGIVYRTGGLPLGAVTPVLATGAFDVASGTWLELDLASEEPPGVVGHGCAYDRATDRVIIFGGVDAAGLVASFDVSTSKWYILDTPPALDGIVLGVLIDDVAPPSVDLHEALVAMLGIDGVTAVRAQLGLATDDVVTIPLGADQATVLGGSHGAMTYVTPLRRAYTFGGIGSGGAPEAILHELSLSCP